MGGFLRQAFIGLVREELSRVTFALTLRASSVCGSNDVAGPTKYSKKGGWLNGGKSVLPSIALIVLCLWAAGANDQAYAGAGRPNAAAEIHYRNTAPGVAYVGSKACATCHATIYQEYIHTDMAQSMSLPHRAPGTGKPESSRHSLQCQTESILSNLSARGRFLGK